MKILLLVVFVLINYLSFAQENININYINPEIHDLIKVAKLYNLKLKQSNGMKFNILTNQWSVSSDKSVNYITIFKKN